MENGDDVRICDPAAGSVAIISYFYAPRRREHDVSKSVAI